MLRSLVFLLTPPLWPASSVAALFQRKRVVPVLRLTEKAIGDHSRGVWSQVSGEIGDSQVFLERNETSPSFEGYTCKYFFLKTK